MPALVHGNPVSAERVRANYDPTMPPSTHVIRMCRDGRCGPRDNLEPLFAKSNTEAPTEWRQGAIPG